jgi:hypothetical protein
MINAIIGDPYKFSIIIGVIKEWNTFDTTFFNGILVFSIDVKLFPPEETFNATLSYEIGSLKQNLKNIGICEDIYYMEKERAFIEMYNIRFPENIDIDEHYEYDISPTIFSDRGHYVFAVSDSEHIRIIASKLKYIKKYSRHDLKKIHIIETSITKDKLNEIISELEKIELIIQAKNIGE